MGAQLLAGGRPNWEPSSNSMKAVTNGKSVMKSKGLSRIEDHGNDNNARHDIKCIRGRSPTE